VKGIELMEWIEALGGGGGGGGIQISGRGSKH